MKRSALYPIILVLFSLSILLASCSPAASTPPTDTVPAVTNTPRQLIIPTFAFVQPTVAPQIATAGATVAAAATANAASPERIQQGRERYETLACWGCHGENGEGVEGRGGALTNMQLTEAEFITVMRTAITLEDGTIHQFSTNLLSDSGGRNLYAYMQSIQQTG